MATAIATPLTRALAQQSQPPRVVVGFASGGGLDVIARTLTAELQRRGKTMLVDNRPGASGRIAIEYVKRAPADGQTILYTYDATMTLFPHVYRKLGYDPVADFMPITTIASTPIALSVGPMVPDTVRTPEQFAQWASSNPDKAAFGTTGAGSSLHFAGIMFARAQKIALTHVPFRGGAAALQDVIGGQIASCVSAAAETLPLLPGGRLRVLAVTSASRWKALPDVPTFRELGYPDMELDAWTALFAPAGTPRGTVNALNETFSQAMRATAVVDALAKMGLDVEVSTPQALASLLQRDLDRWRPVVKASGFSLEE